MEILAQLYTYLPTCAQWAIIDAFGYLPNASNKPHYIHYVSGNIG